MPYALGQDVTACLVADQIVILDIKTNEYLTALPQESAALRQCAKGQASDELVLQALAETGVLRVTDAPDVLVLCHSPIARHSLLDDAPEQYGSGLLAEAISAQFEAACILQLGAIHGALTYLQRAHLRRRTAENRNGITIASATCATLMAQAIIPSNGKCLRRSLGLALLLTRAGHECKLMLGVKLYPFAAHAWVQVGDVVLNDAVDEVIRYTPILAV